MLHSLILPGFEMLDEFKFLVVILTFYTWRQ